MNIDDYIYLKSFSSNLINSNHFKHFIIKIQYFRKIDNIQIYNIQIYIKFDKKIIFKSVNQTINNSKQKNKQQQTDMPIHANDIPYQTVNNFIIAIKCCAMQQIHRYLKQYGSAIVNRLQTQTRQPALYVAAILIDHQQSYQIMKLLLEHHANPHFKDNYQQTVLFYVCREGKQKCLDLLLQHGLSLDQEDIYGQTPLFYVAKENRINIIHKMIEKKVNVNHADKIANQTSLFYAARQGHYDMCKILVEAGCDVLHTDTSNKNAAHYAKKFNWNQVYQYLSNQIQNMKQQRKIIGDSKGIESNQPQEKNTKKQKKRQITYTPPPKAMYRLYRADALGNVTELTMQEFEQLITEYPALADKFKNPDDIDMSNLQEIKAKEAWVKTAQRILTLCQKAKGGYFFLQPVDPAKFGIDDYFEIIQQPMDFGTIKRKLNHNVYSNIQEYIYDMKLVFDNCVKYNGKQNQVAKFAIEIKNLFEENMKQTGFMN